MVAQVVVAGKCVTAATIYYRMLINNTSIATGSGSVAANYYWTWNCGFFGAGLKIGDVLAVKVWSNQTDSDWRHKGMTVMATRVAPFLNRVYRNIFYSLSLAPAYTLGNPGFSTQGLRIWIMDTASYMEQISASKTYEVQYPKYTYGLYRLQHADYSENNSAILRTSPSLYPNVSQNYYPSTLRFRLLEERL
jgi:hypothetical protein